MMDGRAEGGAVASKPTGANKRKGANPVRQIISEGAGPLDLSTGACAVSTKSPVILSVPQYKLVTSPSSPPSSSSSPVKTEPELSVTPVSRPPDQLTSWASLQSLLAAQPQALFSLEQLKQASLIFQKHALNGNTPPGQHHIRSYRVY